MFTQKEKAVKKIKASTIIQELEEICKKSKANEEEVRQSILLILANDINRLNSFQSLGSRIKERKMSPHAVTLATDIKSLEDLTKKLKSGDLATGFNLWK